MRTFFRSVGVYGVCFQADSLLVIDKGRGPFKGKYDLPGGRLEPEESLADALVRECREETGLSVEIVHQLGAFDFFAQWEYQPGIDELLHQIAILYRVVPREGNLAPIVTKADEDALAAHWTPIGLLSENNSSPTVLQACRWMQRNAG